MYHKTPNGFMRSGPGGTYPVNNGDPQCDDDEFDEEEFTTDLEDAEITRYEERYYE